MKNVTIKDIAKKLNVSVSTVSRAFNDKADIRKETKTLILKTAEELGYFPNPIAKNFSKSKSFIVGVVVPELINEYYSEIVIAIQEYLFPKGYQVMVIQSDENQEKELKNVKTLIHYMADGLIIAPVAGNANLSYYLERYQQGYPMVFLNRITESLPVSKVVFNNVKWSFFATEHLIKKQYQKIYHLSGNQNLSVSKKRIEGFLKAMTKHKINRANYKIIETGLLPKDGMNAIDDLVFNQDIPDALFCVNDMVAFGAMKKLKHYGYRIPEDIAIIGFTETRMAELVSPPLSSVKQPTYEMGKKAGALLLDCIKDIKTPTKTIVLNGTLNIRASS